MTAAWSSSADSGFGKEALRLKLRAARARPPAPGRRAALVAEWLRATTRPHPVVACYAALPDEPPTDDLVRRLRHLRATVLLPVLRPDFGLDFAVWDGGPLAAGMRSTREPAASAARLPLAACDLVVVPALAVDRAGYRLGRGGGSYDRALRELRNTGAAAPVLAFVEESELVDQLPHDEHDEPVDGVVLADRLVWLRNRRPA